MRRSYSVRWHGPIPKITSDDGHATQISAIIDVGKVFETRHHRLERIENFALFLHWKSGSLECPTMSMKRTCAISRLLKKDAPRQTDYGQVAEFI